MFAIHNLVNSDQKVAELTLVLLSMVGYLDKAIDLLDHLEAGLETDPQDRSTKQSKVTSCLELVLIQNCLLVHVG